jgi:hypothetical protein
MPVVIHHNTSGETEPHAKSLGGRRGKGQRASDTEGMPMCARHHRQLHDLTGFFGDFDKYKLREWQDRQVRELRNVYAMRHPEPAAPSAAPPSPAKRKRATAEGPRERELLLEEIVDWAGARRLKDHEHQLIHDLLSDLRVAKGT